MIRPARRTDAKELVRMLRALLPGGRWHAEEVRRWMKLPPGTAAFVFDRGNRRLGGFIHLGERAYAEGARSTPVAYIEEWFVDADLRRGGVGRGLMLIAEAWARRHGHVELASDTQLHNTRSTTVHKRIGFKEQERLVLFLKRL